MKYVVELGYHNYYEFDSAMTAVDFAAMAYAHKVDRKDYDYAVVNIKDDDWKEKNNATD